MLLQFDSWGRIIEPATLQSSQPICVPQCCSLSLSLSACVCLMLLQWVVSAATVCLSCHNPNDFASLPPGESPLSFLASCSDCVCREPCSAPCQPPFLRELASVSLVVDRQKHQSHGLVARPTSIDLLHPPHLPPPNPNPAAYVSHLYLSFFSCQCQSCGFYSLKLSRTLS